MLLSDLELNTFLLRCEFAERAGNRPAANRSGSILV